MDDTLSAKIRHAFHQSLLARYLVTRRPSCVSTATFVLDSDSQSSVCHPRGPRRVKKGSHRGDPNLIFDVFNVSTACLCLSVA